MATTEILPSSVTWDPDGLGTGTWASVDEAQASPTDADYITMGLTNSGEIVDQLFGFNPSGVPMGATINSITVYVRGKATYNTLGNPYGDYYGSTYIGSTLRLTAKYTDLNLTTHSTQYTTNPDTGVAWTWQDLYGSAYSNHALRSFGFRGIPTYAAEGGGVETPSGGK